MAMKNFIFFDTETTGNTEEDVLCQIAYAKKERGDTSFEDGEIFVELYNPGKPIPPEASAVHHISNKMVEGKETFKKSSDYEKIKKLFEDKDNIPVAHNAPFDINMFSKEDINIGDFICTLRLVRHMDKDSKIPRYNLQYLRYFLDMDVDAQAHDAKGDVLVLGKLFERLYKKFLDKNNGDEEEAIKEMIEISSKPSIMRVFGFGKYNGQKVEDVAKMDRGYLEWIYNEKLKNPDGEEDWLYTLKYFLEQ